MKKNEFFNFGSKLSSANAVVLAVNLDINKSSRNAFDKEHEHNKLIMGQYDGIDFPVIFKLIDRGKFNDILDTGWASLYLITRKLKSVLEHNNLSGWKSFPVKVYDVKGNEVSDYYGLSITGRCGATKYDQSEIIEKRLVPQGPLVRYYKGISFNDWDGSDFFIPDKTTYIFTEKTAADILKKNNISNMSLTDLADEETDIDMLEI